MRESAQRLAHGEQAGRAGLAGGAYAEGRADGPRSPRSLFTGALVIPALRRSVERSFQSDSLKQV